MKTMRNYLCMLLFGFIAIFSSRCTCLHEEVFRSFVFEYNGITDIHFYDAEGCLRIVPNDTTWKCYSWKSVGAEKSIYDNLCFLHNDTNYYKTVKWPCSVGPYPYYVDGRSFVNDIVLIDIVSGVDFDEQHSAGVSLNDVVRFCSVSPYKYIQSGYTKTFNWDTDCPDNFYSVRDFKSKNHGALFPVNGKLSEMTIEDYILALNWGVDPILIFDSKPTLNEEVPLTVTITLNDGRVFTDSITMRF